MRIIVHTTGSTGIVAAVFPDFVAVANVGDSRAILITPHGEISAASSPDLTITALSQVHIDK